MTLWSLAAAAAAQPFDVETATRLYLETLQGPARARSDAYFEGGYWLILWNGLVGALVNYLLLRTRWSAAWARWAERRTRRRALQTMLYAIPFVLVTALLSLPWTIYVDYVREAKYGLMNQSFAGWGGEQAIALLVSLVTTALILAAVMAVIRRAPRTWWLWGSAVMMGFAAVGLLVTPVFVAPLFNHYTPMAEGPLREQILAMAHANRIPADNVYVVDASRQSKRISANVSGIGPTIRISLNDNLLNRTPPQDVKAVMGHEMGHYVLGHIPVLILEFGAGTLVLLFILSRAVPRILARSGARWGIEGPADVAAVPLYAALVALLIIPATPLLNSMTRIEEAQADRFGLDAAREPDGFADVAMRLSEYRKIAPTPLEELLFFDHPSGRTRVRGAMAWKARHLAELPPGQRTMVRPAPVTP
ncbi:M48 family peptidase [Sphingomonas ginkgonis]|uniref:M48 family peptidase n=1 Tax=Sphingomonas ginkgonis TaxID=2315330 RepID=A0A3R9YL16_9SPHN|nr:M48 family metallopeptidase [Sphingomonas ginkgonis]RST29941.1 M48 family peptidase [Sphingomonas ginkgonis]